jgi:hypothetical protein
MKAMIYWLFVAVALTAFVFGAICGPARMYGWLYSRLDRGMVVKIEPFQTDKDSGDKPKSFLLELQTPKKELFVFASSDRQWSMIKRGEYVRVKLYPSPPWSTESGQWQNGKLLGKMAPPVESTKASMPVATGGKPATPQAAARPAITPPPQQPPKSPPPNASAVAKQPPAANRPPAPTQSPPAVANQQPPKAASGQETAEDPNESPRQSRWSRRK